MIPLLILMGGLTITSIVYLGVVANRQTEDPSEDHAPETRVYHPDHE